MFLREYFRRHHPAIRVSAKEIDSGIENAPSFLQALHRHHIGAREQNAHHRCKCYGRILTLHYGNEKLSANNRNQILSYVLHAAYENELDASGMLLYAQTEKDRHMCEAWSELGHEFHCRTLNLSREFKEIAAELDEIAALMYA